MEIRVLHKTKLPEDIDTGANENTVTPLDPLCADRHCPAPVRRALFFIRTRLRSRLELREIAQAAGLSPFHFGRLFKRTTGMSPHQYLLRARIATAKGLLLSGQRSIAEVAAELGFYDQSHFSQVFKKHCGVTPKQFADKL